MFKIRYAGIFMVILSAMLVLAGCGNTQKESADVVVNSYKIASSNAQIPESFTGTVVAENKTAVHARVSGHVIEKYVKGGEKVTKGQPLYRLDSRQYQADLANAQATAARSNAAYQNAQLDLQRYATLVSEDAIARQTYDTQRSAAEQDKAAYEANQAAVDIAQDNLDDTIIYAPFDGTLEMDAIDVGTYVTAGTTTLVTIDSDDPMYVEFSMSESEYLQFMKNNGLKGLENQKRLQLKLANGQIYPYDGTLVQTAQNLNNGTGKLVLKASFPNPNHLLLPNMYATVISPGDIIKNAILVPTKSIQQVLNKSYVYVIGADGIVKQVVVNTAGTQGMFTIVTSGVKPGETIVVDGLTKVHNGSKVTAKPLTKEQIEQDK